MLKRLNRFSGSPKVLCTNWLMPDALSPRYLKLGKGRGKAFGVSRFNRFAISWRPMSFLLRDFWLLAAFDSGRGLAYRMLGTVQATGDGIGFKEPAQIIASGMEAQLNGASVNGLFQLRWAAEAERNVSSSRDFFDGHRYYS